ncbi:hypothetical protein U9M48_027703, partial [Paspalum notatum var. saurae]
CKGKTLPSPPKSYPFNRPHLACPSRPPHTATPPHCSAPPRAVALPPTPRWSQTPAAPRPRVTRPRRTRRRRSIAARRQPPPGTSTWPRRHGRAAPHRLPAGRRMPPAPDPRASSRRHPALELRPPGALPYPYRRPGRPPARRPGRPRSRSAASLPDVAAPVTPEPRPAARRLVMSSLRTPAGPARSLLQYPMTNYLQLLISSSFYSRFCSSR